MTLTKVAKKVTPQYTYYAYVNQKGNYYWRNPFDNGLLPINKINLKSWTKLT